MSFVQLQVVFLVFFLIASVMIFISGCLFYVKKISVSKFHIFKNLSLWQQSLLYITTMASLISVPVGVLSSGGEFHVSWFIPACIAQSAWLISEVKKDSFVGFLKPFSAILLTLSILVSASGIYTTPYSWWGWTESNLGGIRHESYFSNMKGFQLSESSFAVYSRVEKAELKAQQILQNISPLKANNSVYAYPYSNSVYTLTDLKPSIGMNCVAVWFDLCPNSLISKSLEEFKEVQPSVIIWQDISDEALLVHERLFVREPSNLRKWEEYRLENITNKNWLLIDQIDPGPGLANTTRISVYANLSGK